MMLAFLAGHGPKLRGAIVEVEAGPGGGREKREQAIYRQHQRDIEALERDESLRSLRIPH